MRITVQVKTMSKHEAVERLENGDYCVRVASRPVEGAANERVIELLSDFFECPKTRIRIIKGLKSKIKIVTINE